MRAPLGSETAACLHDEIAETLESSSSRLGWIGHGGVVSVRAHRHGSNLVGALRETHGGIAGRRIFLSMKFLPFAPGFTIGFGATPLLVLLPQVVALLRTWPTTSLVLMLEAWCVWCALSF